jgi:uncharacterized membrane protein YgcG
VFRRLNGTLPIVILVALIACAAGRVQAGIHQLWDEAHFVKPQTIEQADQVLEEIHAKFGKDLMIETFASIPDDYKAKLEQDGKDKFYAGWARTDAHDLGVNGIIILITGDPGHLQIEVGNQTLTKAFTLADRDELVQKLGAAFHTKDFDGGLLMAVQFVRDRMARNLGAGGTARAGAPPAAPPATQPASHPAAPGDDGFGEPAAPAKPGP